MIIILLFWCVMIEFCFIKKLNRIMIFQRFLIFILCFFFVWVPAHEAVEHSVSVHGDFAFLSHSGAGKTHNHSAFSEKEQSNHNQYHHNSEIHRHFNKVYRNKTSYDKFSNLRPVIFAISEIKHYPKLVYLTELPFLPPPEPSVPLYVRVQSFLL